VDHVGRRPKPPCPDRLEAALERFVESAKIVLTHVLVGLGNTKIDLAVGEP
jgi:hypothetical protein